jgi:predicted phage terminase large subunit-like protein
VNVPDGARRVTIGTDLAYTTGAKSDWSAVVVLAEVEDIYYVLEVHRFRMAIEDLKMNLRSAIDAYPEGKAYAYTAGPERAVIHMLLEDGIQIFPLSARYNKLVRAQKCANAWNAGRVRVPLGERWAAAFVKEVTHFTGDEKAHDDQVDAMVAAFDMLAGSSANGVAAGLLGYTQRGR